MDKQNAKRAAAIAAAAAVGSTGGTLGADAVINNNNGVQNETEPSVDENSTHTSSSNHGHSSSHVPSSTEPHVEVVTAPENPDVQITEPANPEIINEPIVEPVEPVTPVEPIITVDPVDPIDPIEPIEPIECMYAGPYDPTIDPVIIDPDSDMYGGPIDPLYVPEDDEVMGMPALDDEEIPSGEETFIEDLSADNNPKESGDVDYIHGIIVEI